WHLRENIAYGRRLIVGEEHSTASGSVVIEDRAHGAAAKQHGVHWIREVDGESLVRFYGSIADEGHLNRLARFPRREHQSAVGADVVLPSDGRLVRRRIIDLARERAINEGDDKYGLGRANVAFQTRCVTDAKRWNDGRRPP